MLLHAARLLGAIVTAPVARRPVRPLAAEAQRPLPGDELVPDARIDWTHAVTIRARPAEIWPWLVQMGCRRAGWYSYDGLDNHGVASAEQVVPELQKLEVGSILPMSATAQDLFVVRAVEPEHALVLGDDAGAMTWAFVLAPVHDGGTRLITRSRATYDHWAPGLLLQVLLRPIHFAMQRRQLLTIKRLVETEPPSADGAGPDVAVAPGAAGEG
jgi:hypothetical protein